MFVGPATTPAFGGGSNPNQSGNESTKCDCQAGMAKRSVSLFMSSWRNQIRSLGWRLVHGRRLVIHHWALAGNTGCRHVGLRLHCQLDGIRAKTHSSDIKAQKQEQRNASKGAELMRFKPQLWDMARYEFNGPNWAPNGKPALSNTFLRHYFPGSRGPSTCGPNKMRLAVGLQRGNLVFLVVS